MSYDNTSYEERLRNLHIELVKLQRHFISNNDKILVIFEGRDAAGKDGVIKRIVKHLSPRETRVVALGKPSDREQSSWYFQRYAPHLPAAGELVLFNRSWYNRAGVERVMGFCTEDEYEEFMGSVVEFEDMLVRSGIKLLKYYLDITRGEQIKRLQARLEDPLKQWKISPIDAQALAHWDSYSEARDDMLAGSHTSVAPWSLVNADNKRQARINVIGDILRQLEYDGKNREQPDVDEQIVRRYNSANPNANGLAV